MAVGGLWPNFGRPSVRPWPGYERMQVEVIFLGLGFSQGSPHLPRSYGGVIHLPRSYDATPPSHPLQCTSPQILLVRASAISSLYGGHLLPVWRRAAGTSMGTVLHPRLLLPSAAQRCFSHLLMYAEVLTSPAMARAKEKQAMRGAKERRRRPLTMATLPALVVVRGGTGEEME